MSHLGVRFISHEDSQNIAQVCGVRQCVSIEENIEAILLRQLTNECVHCDLGSTRHEGITVNQECVNFVLSVPLWEVKTKRLNHTLMYTLHTHSSTQLEIWWSEKADCGKNFSQFTKACTTLFGRTLKHHDLRQVSCTRG